MRRMRTKYNLQALQENLSPLEVAGLLQCVPITARQRWAVRLRHGLDGGAKLTFAEIGRRSEPPVSHSAARSAYAAGIARLLDKQWRPRVIAIIRIAYPSPDEFGDAWAQYLSIRGPSDLPEREAACAPRSDVHALDDIRNLPPSRRAVAYELLSEAARGL